MTRATVRERGRAKAYRPLAATEREAALDAGLAAYRRRDWFLAHELLEPAWMGTDDPAERALHSGLIKLAAAGVHAARRNRAGVAKNLAGARERLAVAAEAAVGGAPDAGLDLVALVDAIERRIATDARGTSNEPADPPRLPRRRRTTTGGRTTTGASAGRSGR